MTEQTTMKVWMAVFTVLLTLMFVSPVLRVQYLRKKEKSDLLSLKELQKPELLVTMEGLSVSISHDTLGIVAYRDSLGVWTIDNPEKALEIMFTLNQAQALRCIDHTEELDLLRPKYRQKEEPVHHIAMPSMKEALRDLRIE